MFKGVVHVVPKTGILDPQGKATEGALNKLGYSSVSGIRVGKVFELDLAVTDREEALKLLDEVSRRILANPVIESYRCEVSEVPGQ